MLTNLIYGDTKLYRFIYKHLITLYFLGWILLLLVGVFHIVTQPEYTNTGIGCIDDCLEPSKLTIYERGF
mgnify:CR=1 FL=1